VCASTRDGNHPQRAAPVRELPNGVPGAASPDGPESARANRALVIDISATARSVFNAAFGWRQSEDA
jgi:hypothetical protein